MLKREQFKLSIEQSSSDEEHLHQDIELLYVLEGNLEIQTENRISRLRSNDVFVVNTNRKHSFHTEGEIVLMRFLINYQVAAENLKNGEVIFWCDSSLSESERYNDLRNLLRRMLKHYVENREYERSFGYLSDCYAVLENLNANFLMRATSQPVSEEGGRYEERLYQINQYIYNNYDQPISMKELSEKLYLSNGYLSRFFKKNYGMNFASYLTNVRLIHAADDLRYTDEPVTRIAYNNGFTSAALFNKVFKKAYGQTPSEFRKTSSEGIQKNEIILPPEDLEKKLERIVGDQPIEEVDEDKKLETIEDELSVRVYDSLKNNWGKMINIGDASNLLQSNVREHLMILHSALGFEYVRFWSIFTEEFFIRPNQEKYNFSQIDSVLDFVFEQGMKPHIELGIKPRVIHYEAGRTESDYQDLMDLYTPEQWGGLIRAFMRHLSRRYGQDHLDDWRMELWFDENWRFEPRNARRYLKLFEATYREVKACNEKIGVGGYGIRMDVGFEKRKEFLRRWKQSGPVPDFISIMYYAYERGEDELDRYARRITDNDALLHFIKREKELIADAGMGDLPVYLTEWNLTPSVRNYMNDSTFKGAYIIKNTLDMYGAVEIAGYGAGSDRQYTSYDTPQLLFGGTGLITKDGILKPAAFAYDFLNRLFPYYLGKGSNYLVSTDRHDNYGIICHNQRQLNYNYYLTSETDLEKESLWKYSEDNASLRISLHLDQATDGLYQVKTYRINATHGSVLNVWSELGYEKELSRNDIKYLRRACEPIMTIRQVEARNGELPIEETLVPNEIVFLRVRYIGE